MGRQVGRKVSSVVEAKFKSRTACVKGNLCVKSWMVQEPEDCVYIPVYIATRWGLEDLYLDRKLASGHDMIISFLNSFVKLLPGRK